ncbi:5'-nucleotidase SurE [Rubripirellula lacrimiformis]|uniref:5'-nucleotidase n=1 Tax=Rubripirellula lacrimiformis TaxID=1930273 RepID=A0A517N3X4_9BACT|nr:5'/3'-nucleotidase SurE [Rubripirellula lacrimiformis]QDT01843.1 5'-nucleotidase SurE [Rubripirellula lacrimiformis]
MNILLTNDDGIDAPGLAALYESIQRHIDSSISVVVVAPDRGRSECGHSVTTSRALTVQEVRKNWHSVDGTPVDCVRVATATVQPEIDLVISGINAGANLGADLLVSGTFAAAREASMQGIPAMAVSHYRHPEIESTWDHVGDWLGDTIAEFLRLAESKQPIPSVPLWNVNLPAINPSGPRPNRVECDVDQLSMIRTAKRTSRAEPDRIEVCLLTDFHRRPRAEGSDVDLCFGGQITLSRLNPRIV